MKREVTYVLFVWQFHFSFDVESNCLSNGNSVRLGGPGHKIVTKTVHKTLPGGGGGRGWGV